ncbi:penicillin-binding protein [Virgibacillus sp. MSP4-1]|uniref:transglycosylase domain-containing protein n=1 Tax=Virgibacillus sp. MSP4-1 TaxID=2700081 RepID=UPI0003A6E007|nr:transglycosylase domain-containing protein [Virgibacillus sp. MSP4-1]QHS23041.1 penicillin-binding protein [Virgibacillus sp. MSP4-1]
MNEKFSQFVHKVKSWWQAGKLQRFSRITSDVTWNIILIILVFGLIGAFFVGGLGVGYFASLVKDEPIRSYADMRQDIYNYEETTELYFADNNYLGKLRSNLHREEVDVDDVSDHVINAVIATEDQLFKDHQGIVPKAILRALFQEFTNSTTQSGGSTLTQQLIKNQILTNEVSFERKAKEILLALRLENFFKKEEILEAYLNVVPYGRDSSGRNIAGIQTAAQGIFGVDSKDLNIPQAAFLAGLPQSPFGYSPFSNGGELKSKEGLEPGFNRMKTVLNRMLETGYITEQEYQDALNYDLTKDFIEPQPSPIQEYPYLTFEIEEKAAGILAERLAEEDGYTKEDLENNDQLREQYNIMAKRNLQQEGYKIHTTVDKKIYDAHQKIAKKYEHFKPSHTILVKDPETGETKQKKIQVQPGAILIENKTGRILSFVGGSDYQQNQNNHALDTPRPNGSTMKPLLDFAPAMEKGIIQPASPVLDVKGENGWYPSNYVAGSESGITTARTALTKSLNIPTARIYKKMLGDQPPPATYLDRMGFSTLIENEYTSDYENPSMSIGSMSLGVSVEENVNAFATFANMGTFVDAYMIEKIETKDGKVIYEHETEKEEVFSPQTSYLTLDLMRDVISSGTGTYVNSVLNNPGVDWAGKTGSTENIQDAWFVATNPNVTIGTRIGYDTYDKDGDGDGYGHPSDNKWNDPDRLIHLNYGTGSGLSYSNRNILFWGQLVNAATEIRPDLMAPDQRFGNPGGIVTRSVCAVSGLIPSEACEEAGLITTDLFNAKYVPTEEDNSLIKGNYVKVDGKFYPAAEGTPEEFTEEGFMLNPEFLEEKGWDDVSDLEKIIPNNKKWEKIQIPEMEELANDGKTPSAPTNVSISGKTLSWNASPEKDVIGYRVHMAGEPGEPGEAIGNTKKTNFTLPSKNQVYYVTAIDYFGQESAISEPAVHGDINNNPLSINNLSASVSKDGLRLTWNNPQSDDFSHVKVIKDSKVAGNQITGNSYVDKDIEPDKSYTYTVIAVSKDGDESQGKSINVKTKPVDQPPSDNGNNDNGNNGNGNDEDKNNEGT